MLKDSSPAATTPNWVMALAQRLIGKPTLIFIAGSNQSLNDETLDVDLFIVHEERTTLPNKLSFFEDGRLIDLNLFTSAQLRQVIRARVGVAIADMVATARLLFGDPQLMQSFSDTAHQALTAHLPGFERHDVALRLAIELHGLTNARNDRELLLLGHRLYTFMESAHCALLGVCEVRGKHFGRRAAHIAGARWPLALLDLLTQGAPYDREAMSAAAIDWLNYHGLEWPASAAHLRHRWSETA